MLRVQNVSLVFFDTVPFLMELKEDDICGRGHVLFLRWFCGCNCKVCTFAHFFRKFLRSFWFPFAQSCHLGDRSQGWVWGGLVRASLVGKLYTSDPKNIWTSCTLLFRHPNFEQSTWPTSVSDKFWFSVNIMRDLKKVWGYWWSNSGSQKTLSLYP